MRRIWFIGITAFLAFIALTAFMTWRVWMGIQTNSWIKTEGVLQQVTIQNVANENELMVQYSYVVGDRSFSDSRISFRMWDPPSVSALQQQQGHPITIFYDSKSPNHAVLFRGTSFSDVIFALIPFSVACAAGFVMFVFRKIEISRKPKTKL
jgi:hypothetical protein